MKTELTKEQAINLLIDDERVDSNVISDGYHTFGELYDHRITLFIALCRLMHDKWMHTNNPNVPYPWRSKAHSDGSIWDGWFILGIGDDIGNQITYHLPISRWDECEFATTRNKAPEWDGHTSQDVLERLKEL